MSREEFNNVQAKQVANTAYNGNELYDKGIVRGEIFVLPEEMRNERVEITLNEGYQFVDENGNVINAQKIVLEKKKQKYPNTVDRCRAIVGAMSGYGAFGYQAELITSFMSLLICRDAYWKIAGDEMGLGKPWKPNDSSGYCTYAILRHTGHIRKSRPYADSELLEFPTEDMRDAFYENFKELIIECQELLWHIW